MSLGADGEAGAARWTLSKLGRRRAHQAPTLSCSAAGRGPGLLNHIRFNGHLSLAIAPRRQELIKAVLFQDSRKPFCP